jgi:methionine aminopeptidase
MFLCAKFLNFILELGMSRNGYAVMNARKAHIGGGKEENGKRRNTVLDGTRSRANKRGMSLEELRRAVLDRIPNHKRGVKLKDSFLRSLHTNTRISEVVFQYLPDPEVTVDPAWKQGVLYLRSVGRKKVVEG